LTSLHSDVGKFVVRRTYTNKAGKTKNKAPKIQRLVTPVTLQRKRNMKREEGKRHDRVKEEMAAYEKLRKQRMAEQKERRASELAKRKSRDSQEAAAPVAAAPPAKGGKAAPAKGGKAAPAKAAAAAPAKPAAKAKKGGKQ
jgi:small subunit ribosomal protein S6e